MPAAEKRPGSLVPCPPGGLLALSDPLQAGAGLTSGTRRLVSRPVVPWVEPRDLPRDRR